jgi:hypothetical protein
VARRHILGVGLGLALLGCDPLAAPAKDATPTFVLAAKIGVVAPNFVEASKTCEQMCVSEASGAPWRAQVVEWRREDAWNCECHTAQAPAQSAGVIQANAPRDPMQPRARTAVIGHRQP